MMYFCSAGAGTGRTDLAEALDNAVEALLDGERRRASTQEPSQHCTVITNHLPVDVGLFRPWIAWCRDGILACRTRSKAHRARSKALTSASWTGDLGLAAAKCMHERTRVLRDVLVKLCVRVRSAMHRCAARAGAGAIAGAGAGRTGQGRKCGGSASPRAPDRQTRPKSKQASKRGQDPPWEET